VRGSHVAGPYAIPFRVIADLGQVPENFAHPSSKQRCHVLHDREGRSNHANGSKKFPPESRAFAGKSGALSSKADILAREPTADNVGISFCMVDGADIFMDWDIWPMVGEDFAGARVVFTEGNCSHSGSFEAKGEPSNSREKVKHVHRITPHALRISIA
jgi:hypothetical protein